MTICSVFLPTLHEIPLYKYELYGVCKCLPKKLSYLKGKHQLLNRSTQMKVDLKSGFFSKYCEIFSSKDRLSISRIFSLALKGVSVTRCPSRFGPPQIWTPWSKFASGFGRPGPNPLANMDPRGTQSARGFGPPSRIWTPYVIVKTHAVIRI